MKTREFSLGDIKAYVQEKRCAITENRGSRILSKNDVAPDFVKKVTVNLPKNIKSQWRRQSLTLPEKSQSRHSELHSLSSKLRLHRDEGRIPAKNKEALIPPLSWQLIAMIKKRFVAKLKFLELIEEIGTAQEETPK
jgi:hypothetical protein